MIFLRFKNICSTLQCNYTALLNDKKQWYTYNKDTPSLFLYFIVGKSLRFLKLSSSFKYFSSPFKSNYAVINLNGKYFFNLFLTMQEYFSPVLSLPFIHGTEKSVVATTNQTSPRGHQIYVTRTLPRENSLLKWPRFFASKNIFSEESVQAND